MFRKEDWTFNNTPFPLVDIMRSVMAAEVGSLDVKLVILVRPCVNVPLCELLQWFNEG